MEDVSTVKVFVSYNAAMSIVTDKDLHGRNVLHFNLVPLLRDCSTITQS